MPDAASELRTLRHRLDALLTELEYHRESSPSRGEPSFVGQIFNGGSMANGDGPNYCLVHPVINVGGSDPEAEGGNPSLITDDTIAIPVALESKAIVGHYIIATQIDGRWVSGANQVRKFCVVVSSQCEPPPTSHYQLWNCDTPPTFRDFTFPGPLPKAGDAVMPTPEGLVVTITDGAIPPNIIAQQALTGQLALGVATGGRGFTSLPSITVIDPTGTGAKFYPVMAIDQTTIASGGAKYKVNDVVKLTGLQWLIPARYTVTAVDANGAITGLRLITDAAPAGGPFTTLPTGPVGLDGGSGVDASVTLTFSLYQVVMTDPGKMYTPGQVVATVTGGGGVGATLNPGVTFKICTGPIQPGVYFVSFPGIPANPPNTGSLPYYHGFYVGKDLVTTTQLISLSTEYSLLSAAIASGIPPTTFPPGSYTGQFTGATVDMPTVSPTWTPSDYYYPTGISAFPNGRQYFTVNGCYPVELLQNDCVYINRRLDTPLRYPDTINLTFDHAPLWGDKAGRTVTIQGCQPFWNSNLYQVEVNNALLTFNAFWLIFTDVQFDMLGNFTGLDHDPCFYADPVIGKFYLASTRENQAYISSLGNGVLLLGGTASFTLMTMISTDSLLCRCQITGVDPAGIPICNGNVPFEERVGFVTLTVTGGPYD